MEILQTIHLRRNCIKKIENRREKNIHRRSVIYFPHRSQKNVHKLMPPVSCHCRACNYRVVQRYSRKRRGEQLPFSQ